MGLSFLLSRKCRWRTIMLSILYLFSGSIIISAGRTRTLRTHAAYAAAPAWFLPRIYGVWHLRAPARTHRSALPHTLHTHPPHALRRAAWRCAAAFRRAGGTLSVIGSVCGTLWVGVFFAVSSILVLISILWLDRCLSVSIGEQLICYPRYRFFCMVHSGWTITVWAASSTPLRDLRRYDWPDFYGRFGYRTGYYAGGFCYTSATTGRLINPIIPPAWRANAHYHAHLLITTPSIRYGSSSLYIRASALPTDNLIPVEHLANCAIPRPADLVAYFIR